MPLPLRPSRPGDEHVASRTALRGIVTVYNTDAALLRMWTMAQHIVHDHQHAKTITTIKINIINITMDKALSDGTPLGVVYLLLHVPVSSCA